MQGKGLALSAHGIWVDKRSLHDTQHAHEHNGDMAHTTNRAFLRGKARVCTWYTVGISLHKVHDVLMVPRYQARQAESVAEIQAIQQIILD